MYPCERPELNFHVPNFLGNKAAYTYVIIKIINFEIGGKNYKLIFLFLHVTLEDCNLQLEGNAFDITLQPFSMKPHEEF